MVVTGTGYTVYVYLPDSTHPPATTCTADCANDWPPVLAPSAPPHLGGIKPSLVGVTVRPGGARQLTLAGYPLYRFAGDRRPGDADGESIGNTWFAVGPDGSFLALPPVAFGGAAAASQILRVVSRPGGPVVADGAGQTVYTFRDDRVGRSACVDSWCTQDWPAVVADGPAIRPPGITARVGVLRRPDGIVQVTLDGHPLYVFAGDTQPGDARGLGIGGDWFPITPNGAKVTR